MSLSFPYLAFVRVLQLFRLLRHDNGELAVEVVMLRYEGVGPSPSGETPGTIDGVPVN